MPSFVTITHPELGTSQVIPSSLPVWLERGWTSEEAASGEVTTPASPEVSEPPCADCATPEFCALGARACSTSDVTGT